MQCIKKNPGLTYSACGPSTKSKKRIEKFMQAGNTDFICRNELDKACFQHDVAYSKSKEKIYHELGLESLEKRRWYRKLCCFYKIFRSQSPQYLFNIIPTFVRPYNTRNADNIPQFKVKHNFFKNSFFPSVVIEWNKLDLNIRDSENLFIFKKKLLKFIRPSGNSVFKCHNPKRIKLLTRLKLGISHL